MALGTTYPWGDAGCSGQLQGRTAIEADVLCVCLSYYQQGNLVARTDFVGLKSSPFLVVSLISLTTGSTVSSSANQQTTPHGGVRVKYTMRASYTHKCDSCERTQFRKVVTHFITIETQNRNQERPLPCWARLHIATFLSVPSVWFDSHSTS